MFVSVTIKILNSNVCQREREYDTYRFLHAAFRTA